MKKNSALRSSSQAGFTLIELLVVAGIIITLTGIGLVNMRTTSEKSRNGKREGDIAQIRAALELHRAAEGEYPAHGSVGSPSSGSFSSLMSNSSFQNYMATVSVTDPKNATPYVYKYGSDGIQYTVCYTLEPDAAETCQNNP